MEIKARESKMSGGPFEVLNIRKCINALSFTMIVGLAALSGCNKNDTTVAETRITPKTAKPEWGPTIKPELQRVTEVHDSLTGGVPLTALSPQEARKAPTVTDAVMGVIKEYNIPMTVSMVDTTGNSVPVEGGKIHVRIYRPKNMSGQIPGIVYYHGGGWVIASIDAYDASARALAEQSSAVVVSVEYRKAPEYKFPTAHNDSYAAYKWVLDNASSLDINPGKIAIAGESAGGNLAASVSMMARDSGVAVPVHQLLIYPIADYYFGTESYKEFANAKPLGTPLMQWFFKQYLNNQQEGRDARISLVKVNNLSGLPSATIINAEIDPLQTEGQTFANKLKNAGIPVTSKVYEGAIHEFFGMAIVSPQAKEAQTLAAAELKKAFNKFN